MYKKEKNGMKEEIQANYHSQERLVCTVDITKRMVSWHAHPMNKFVHHIWVGLEREPSVVGSHDINCGRKFFQFFCFTLVLHKTSQSNKQNVFVLLTSGMSWRTGRPGKSGGGRGGGNSSGLKPPLDLSVVGGALNVDSESSDDNEVQEIHQGTSRNGSSSSSSGGGAPRRTTVGAGVGQAVGGRGRGHAPPSPARGGLDPKRRRTNSGRHVLPPLSTSSAASAGGAVRPPPPRGSGSSAGSSRSRASTSSASNVRGVSSGGGGGRWTCSQCTLTNTIEQTGCAVCGALRPTPPPPRPSARGTATSDPITLGSDDDSDDDGIEVSAITAAPVQSPRQYATRGGKSRSGSSSNRSRIDGAAAVGAAMAAATVRRTRGGRGRGRSGGGSYNSDYFAGAGGSAAHAAALAQIQTQAAMMAGGMAYVTPPNCVFTSLRES